MHHPLQFSLNYSGCYVASNNFLHHHQERHRQDGFHLEFKRAAFIPLT